jgi:hypothetical protein
MQNLARVDSYFLHVSSIPLAFLTNFFNSGISAIMCREGIGVQMVRPKA